MAAHRSDGFAGAIARVWGRGGVFGCELLASNANHCYSNGVNMLTLYQKVYQGLIPWVRSLAPHFYYQGRKSKC
jgi:hypothetical protein